MTSQMSWPPAAATGVGSLPGTAAQEAARLVVGELPDVPHVPELPGRGPGADAVGRTAGLLSLVTADLGLETTPSGWRLAAGGGRSMRRSRAWLGEDLDAVEEAAQGFSGLLKAQLVGPWTWAASVELPAGERVLRDPGAVRDVASALALAVTDHVADLRRRVPGARVLLQLDEPVLPAVLGAGIRTASGLGRYRSVEPSVASAALGAVLGAARAAGAIPMVHCCGTGVPVALLHGAGAQVISFDLGLVDSLTQDEIGTAVDAGVRFIVGALPSSGPAPSVSESVRRIQAWWSRLGFAPDLLPSVVAISPTCGLAGAAPAEVIPLYASARAVGRALAEPDALAEEDPQQKELR